MNWPQERGVNTRAELLKFHKKHYSANIMTLVVLGQGQDGNFDIYIFFTFTICLLLLLNVNSTFPFSTKRYQFQCCLSILIISFCPVLTAINPMPGSFTYCINESNIP